MKTALIIECVFLLIIAFVAWKNYRNSNRSNRTVNSGNRYYSKKS